MFLGATHSIKRDVIAFREGGFICFFNEFFFNILIASQSKSLCVASNFVTSLRLRDSVARPAFAKRKISTGLFIFFSFNNCSVYFSMWRVFYCTPCRRLFTYNPWNFLFLHCSFSHRSLLCHLSCVVSTRVNVNQNTHKLKKQSPEPAPVRPYTTTARYHPGRLISRVVPQRRPPVSVCRS